MKKYLPLIGIATVLVIGVCVLLYPVVSAILSKMTQSATISTYQQSVEDLSGDEIARMKEEARQYNETLSSIRLTDPFAGGDEPDSVYASLLSVDDVMGYIEIPKIDVYLPIYHGTSEEVLQTGVGHLEHTSLPIGGAGTHAVLTGHRGLPSSILFTDLDQLAQGDVFYIHVLDEILAYQVDQVKVVEPEEIGDLAISSDKDYVTLVTCTPYGINTQRLLIRGERTDQAAEDVTFQPAATLTGDAVMVPSILLILVLFPLVWLLHRRRRFKK